MPRKTAINWANGKPWHLKLGASTQRVQPFQNSSQSIVLEGRTLRPSLCIVAYAATGVGSQKLVPWLGILYTLILMMSDTRFEKKGRFFLINSAYHLSWCYLKKVGTFSSRQHYSTTADWESTASGSRLGLLILKSSPCPFLGDFMLVT